MNPSSIVIAEENAHLLHEWVEWLQEAGFEAVGRCNIRKAAEAQSAALLIAGSGCNQDLIAELRALHLPVVCIAGAGCEETVIGALRAGCSDYLRLPVGRQELVGVVRRFCTAAVDSLDGLIGESPIMRELRCLVKRIARVRSNVLITGETGTGKELVARAIHRHSDRAARPFVCINCAAIPESLVESELFGYERGAFTGAASSRVGKLEAAEAGTVFLDEVGDMSLMAQAKILRAVETREVYRLGGRSAVPINIRIVAATHRNLEKMAQTGEFRSDLLYRLNVTQVRLSPLRERPGDIQLIARYCMAALNRELDTMVESLSDGLWERLLNYSWPGNVRELRNMLESFLVQAPSKTIALEDLPADLRAKLVGAYPEEERERLLSALMATRWNKSKAAEKLHWSRMTLYRKMTKYSLHYSPE